MLPTRVPTSPSHRPSAKPSFPSKSPTRHPSRQPSISPTAYPTSIPTPSPTPAPTPCQYDLLSESFESATFEERGWSATGLWIITSACSENYGAADSMLFAYYGLTQTCTYNDDNDEANGGELSSPMIIIPSSPTASITLSYTMRRETEADQAYDTTQVFINGDLLDQPMGDFSTDWITRTCDLAAYKGQSIRLDFTFLTYDTQTNDHLGWQIDKVQIMYNNCQSPT